MSMRVLVFAGSRSQLLQHIPVERTVRSFRAWEPRLVLSSERGDHALWAPLLDDYDVTPCHRLGPAPASLSDASLLAHIMSSASLLLHRAIPSRRWPRLWPQRNTVSRSSMWAPGNARKA